MFCFTVLPGLVVLAAADQRAADCPSTLVNQNAPALHLPCASDQIVREI